MCRLATASFGSITHVSAFGCGLSLFATLFTIIGLIPFLGWLNWITSLPLAILAMAAFYLALQRPTKTVVAQAGFFLSTMLVCTIAYRLFIGGGVI